MRKLFLAASFLIISSAATGQKAYAESPNVSGNIELACTVYHHFTAAVYEHVVARCFYFPDVYDVDIAGRGLGLYFNFTDLSEPSEPSTINLSCNTPKIPLDITMSGFHGSAAYMVGGQAARFGNSEGIQCSMYGGSLFGFGASVTWSKLRIKKMP